MTAEPTRLEPPPISGAVICGETKGERAELAAVVAVTPDTVIVTPWGERFVRAAVALIDKVDAGCAG